MKKLFRKLKIHLSRIFGLKRRVLFFDGVTLTDKKVSKKELKNKNVKNIDGFEMVDEAKLDPPSMGYIEFRMKHKDIINQIPFIWSDNGFLFLKYDSKDSSYIDVDITHLTSEEIGYIVEHTQQLECFNGWLRDRKRPVIDVVGEDKYINPYSK